MSTLNALRLERDLGIARAAATQRPVLVMQWHIDASTGRPIGAWTVQPAAAHAIVLPEAAFA